MEGKRTVLIIEADTEVRGMTATILRENGWIVEVARSEDEGEEKWVKCADRGAYVDLIIGSAGSGIFDMLHVSVEFRDLPPCIVTTGGNPDLSDMEMILEFQATLLKKPYGMFELLGAIEKALRR